MSQIEKWTLALSIISSFIALGELIWEKVDSFKIRRKHKNLDDKTEKYRTEIIEELKALKNLKDINSTLTKMLEHFENKERETKKIHNIENLERSLDSTPLIESNKIKHS